VSFSAGMVFRRVEVIWAAPLLCRSGYCDVIWILSVAASSAVLVGGVVVLNVVVVGGDVGVVNVLDIRGVVVVVVVVGIVGVAVGSISLSDTVGVTVANIASASDDDGDDDGV
jgi:hypothetical protein